MQGPGRDFRRTAAQHSVRAGAMVHSGLKPLGGQTLSIHTKMGGRYHPVKKGMTTVSIIGACGSSLHNCLYTVRVRAGATVHRVYG